MSNQQARSGRERRIERILKDPRARPSPLECGELVAHLSAQGVSDVTVTFQALSLSLIPPHPPLSLTNPTRLAAELQSIQLASGSLKRLSIIAQAIHEPRSASPATASFGQWLHLTFLERWEAVAGWMAYLLIHIDSAIEDARGRTHFIRACANLLLTIVADAGHDPVKEELATRPSTIDCVYVLLGCKGHTAEAGWYCDVPNESDSACAVLELFRACFEIPSGPNAMRAGILRKKRKQRSLIAKSLERRGEQLIWGRVGSIGSISLKFNPGSLRNLRCLIEGVLQLLMERRLWGMFKDASSMYFLHTYAYAFANLAEMVERTTSPNEELWQSLGSCAYLLALCAIHLAPEPRVALTHMFMEGHFLRGATICFASISGTSASSNEVFQAMEMVIPYAYLSKVYGAAESRGEVSNWIQRKDFKSSRATHILAESQRLLKCASGAGLENLCSYFDHGTSRQATHKNMLCSGCRSITYCSAWCQAKDWGLHSRECKQLAAQQNAQRYYNSSISLRTRRDQRRTLEAIVNLELPPPVELKRGDPEAPPGPSSTPGLGAPFLNRGVPSISSFDFMVSEGAKLEYTRVPTSSHFSNPRFRATLEPWIPRLDQWVQHVEMNWGSSILVDGIFRAHSGCATIIIAIVGRTLSIAPDGKQDESYEILHTMYSVFTS